MAGRRNRVEQAWKAGEFIEADKMYELIMQARISYVPLQTAWGMSAEQWNQVLILRRNSDASVAEMAELLGIPQATLYQALQKWDEAHNAEARRRKRGSVWKGT